MITPKLGQWLDFSSVHGFTPVQSVNDGFTLLQSVSGFTPVELVNGFILFSQVNAFTPVQLVSDFTPV